MPPMGMNPTKAMSTLPSKPQAKQTRPMKGATMKTGQKVTLKPSKPGQKKISFKKGGLHHSLGVPQGKKIPPAKKKAALAGKYGAKAKQQAEFAKNVLTGKK